MYWNVSACTIWGLRAKESVRQEDATRNNEDGTIVKNNCSKLRLKSNPLLSCWSSASLPVMKVISSDEGVAGQYHAKGLWGFVELISWGHCLTVAPSAYQWLLPDLDLTCIL